MDKLTENPIPKLPDAGTSLDDMRARILLAVEAGAALLSAPPGAGKSTRVPLWLLEAPFLEGKKILLLEPRRVAARALARYMAACLGEKVGETVGLRMRQETLCGPATRLEVITEGVLSRMLMQDAELPGVGCVIFDEFHERSLHADTGLALCLESRAILRPDLCLLVMSATLEVDALARLLPDAAHLHCEGRHFPVDIRHLPPPPGMTAQDLPGLLRHAAGVISRLLREEQGSMLVFLPGVGEIRRLEELLQGNCPADVDILPLYGQLAPDRQDAAIAPCPSGRRKVVLATNVAETSLTIEGVRLVVDAGLAREPRYDPADGLTRLVTCRISLASAAQRAGRAGRLEPGVCVRLWHKEEENGMRPHIRPEIVDADLTQTVLQLAVWGVPRPEELPWPDQPPAAHLAAAREDLVRLEALEPGVPVNRPTPLGLDMAALPLPPRLARLLLLGEQYHNAALACCLAVLLEDRDPLPQADASLLHRLDRLCRGPSSDRETGDGVIGRLRQWARQLTRLLICPPQGLFEEAQRQSVSTGLLTALTFPERVAQRTGEVDGQAHYVLRCGSRAFLPLTDPLARQPFLAVAVLDGGHRRHVQGADRGRIRLAVPLPPAEVESLFSAALQRENRVEVTDEGRIIARQQRRLDALVLEDLPLPRPDGSACAQALCGYIRRKGLACLPWSEAMRQWRARVALLHEQEGEPWPAVTDAALLEHLEDWLAPFLDNCTDLQRLSPARLAEALRALLPYPLPRRLEELAPTQWTSPAGITHPIVYGEEGGPHVAAKLQEFFGCTQTPAILGGRLPLLLHLLSPAGRPLQVTRDLVAFWANGYRQVRAEMRGRYPKHPWPEDPLAAPPAARTKKQMERERGPQGGTV
ncbi:ATP-dependent helicase HrpB [uncultured Desulfovibrio sp.]|uniref:ATP-dependent helicase HrpB n=1 Tax=uncultured Desulfovibrio sp. TaxID=167968 RepID=UPI0026316BBC|nr:ATP-dependent helicase HrpB [uncultured Desulfovibrio sp.]